MSTVKPVILDALYNELRRAGASEHKVRKAHRVLSACFGRSVKYEWMTSNPCASATKSKVHTKEIVPPTMDEVSTVLAAAVAVNADLAMCLRLAATIGARRAELCCLQWRDLQGDQLTIRRSLVEEDDKTIQIRPTKTGTCGHHTIAIDEKNVANLAVIRVRQRADAERTGLPESEWIFTHEDLETPWRPTTSRRPTHASLRRARRCTACATSTQRNCYRRVGPSRTCRTGSAAPVPWSP